MEGSFLNITEVIYEESIVNIILKKENLKIFLLKSEIRQKYPLSSLLFDPISAILARAIRQEEKKKRDANRKEVKMSLFADDMILSIENFKNSARSL